MNKEMLSKKQANVFEIIKSYIDSHKEAPTILELRKILSVSSLRTVSQYLNVLERKGFIRRIKYGKRSIEIIGEKKYFNPSTLTIKIIGAAGCDNKTIYADEKHGETITIDKSLLKDFTNKNNVIGIKALGNSMSDFGIEDGDIVLVEITEKAINGDRIVAIIDDMAVIKKVFFTNDAVILYPESKNKDYKPIVMNKDFKIFGKVRKIIKMPHKNIDEELTYHKLDF